ncbi:MAG: leucine-rich repeat domain-containing protein [Bacteroidales bacterium]|nr:leucine-rich repeat domain-containing protein [Bacteroidales bacterium]
MTKNLFVILLFSVFAIPLSYGERYSDSGNLQFNELDPYVMYRWGKRYEYRKIQHDDLIYVLWEKDSCAVVEIDTTFHGEENKKRLIIPESINVDSVNYKVVSCRIHSNYESVTLPKFIHSMSFGNSKSKEIDLSECDELYKLHLREFSKCVNLQKIKLPHNLQKIDSYTFSECSSLREVELPESLQRIFLYSFYGCKNLQHLKIPKNVKKIYILTETEKLQLRNEKNLNFKSIEVDKDNEFFCSENGVIYSKDKTDLIYYPSSKEDSIFVVPNSVKRIGPFAFFYARHLKRVYLPDSIFHIGHNAFEGCSLDSMWLPKRLVYVDKFSMPDNQLHIYFNGEVSFDVRNPVCFLHLTDGRVIRSTEYINQKPIDENYYEYLSCDSVSILIKKITEVCRTADYWENGWFEGDSTSWRIIKCGKEIIPCLISMIGDTTQVLTSQSFTEGPIVRTETVSTVIYGLLSGMISDLGKLMYEKGIYTILFINYRLTYPMDYYLTTYDSMREFLNEWYEKNKDDLIWVNNLGFYEASNPAGGYYMLRKQGEK